jgi:hypothetical protein
VPFEAERPLALDRRVLVHVGVVDVEVPSEDRPHIVEGPGVVEKEREFRAGGDGVEAVHGTFRAQSPGLFLDLVHAVQCVVATLKLFGVERATDHQVAVTIEGFSLLRGESCGTDRCQCGHLNAFPVSRGWFVYLDVSSACLGCTAELGKSGKTPAAFIIEKTRTQRIGCVAGMLEVPWEVVEISPE